MLKTNDESESRAFCAAEPKALTIKQAVRYSGLSRSFIYTLFDTGKLPRLKAGKRVLIMRSDLDRYLASIREGGE